MTAGVYDLLIQQGATFRRRLLLTNKKKVSASAVIGVYLEGTNEVEIAPGGFGSILAGEYVCFYDDKTRYKVLIGIDDLEIGGVLTLEYPLQKTLYVYRYSFAVNPYAKVNVVTPVNLTGNTPRAMLRQKATDVLPVLSFTTSIDPDPTAGFIDISLTDIETSSIVTTGNDFSQVAPYVWDLELETTGGEVTRLLNGKVQVSPEVTK